MPRGTGGGQHGSSSIFQRMRLAPSQLRTVADWRFGDAMYLRRSGQNARANGAMYLGGFVLECLLKAKLLEKHAWLKSTLVPAGLPARETRLWFLCYRSHDLEGLLAEIPEVLAQLGLGGGEVKMSLIRKVKEICAEWTVFARYSPLTATMHEAAVFLDAVNEVRKCLR